MFLIDKYSNLINDSPFNDMILNNIYNQANNNLDRLKKIKKSKT